MFVFIYTFFLGGGADCSQAGIEEGEAALQQTKALKSKPGEAVMDAEEVAEKETEAAT